MSQTPQKYSPTWVSFTSYRYFIFSSKKARFPVVSEEDIVLHMPDSGIDKVTTWRGYFQQKGYESLKQIIELISSTAKIDVPNPLLRVNRLSFSHLKELQEKLTGLRNKTNSFSSMLLLL